MAALTCRRPGARNKMRAIVFLLFGALIFISPARGADPTVPVVDAHGPFGPLSSRDVALQRAAHEALDGFEASTSSWKRIFLAVNDGTVKVQLIYDVAGLIGRLQRRPGDILFRAAWDLDIVARSDTNVVATRILTALIRDKISPSDQDIGLDVCAMIPRKGITGTDALDLIGYSYYSARGDSLEYYTTPAYEAQCS